MHRILRTVQILPVFDRIGIHVNVIKRKELTVLQRILIRCIMCTDFLGHEEIIDRLCTFGRIFIVGVCRNDLFAVLHDKIQLFAVLILRLQCIFERRIVLAAVIFIITALLQNALNEQMVYILRFDDITGCVEQFSQ